MGDFIQDQEQSGKILLFTFCYKPFWIFLDTISKSDSKMSWGTELWDQWDNIGQHTQKGPDFCERYIHFLKERSSVEMDYARQLKKLVKNFQPKKRDEDDYQFSWSKS